MNYDTFKNQPISSVLLKTYSKAFKHSSGLKIRLTDDVRRELDIDHKQKVKAVVKYQDQATDAECKAYHTNSGMKLYVPADEAKRLGMPVQKTVQVCIVEVLE